MECHKGFARLDPEPAPSIWRPEDWRMAYLEMMDGWKMEDDEKVFQREKFSGEPC